MRCENHKSILRFHAVEILVELLDIIDELREIPEDEAIIVEGRKDREALRILGITGNIEVLNDGHSIVETCEMLSEEYSFIHILTDWDRKGGQIGRKITEQLRALGVRYSMEERRKMAYLCRKEIKDVESLPELIIRLKEEQLTTHL